MTSYPTTQSRGRIFGQITDLNTQTGMNMAMRGRGTLTNVTTRGTTQTAKASRIRVQPVEGTSTKPTSIVPRWG